MKKALCILFVCVFAMIAAVACASADFTIVMEKNVLAPGEQITLSLSPQPEGDVIWHAVYGSVTTKEGQARYTAPDAMPPDSVDTVSAALDQDGTPVTLEAYVLVLDAAAAGQWVRTGGPHGGTISVIDIDPVHDGVLYAGGSGNRLFKSLDYGETWRGLKIDEESSSPASLPASLSIPPTRTSCMQSIATR